MQREKPVVLVPAYNEATNVAKMLHQLSALQKKGVIGKVVLVDDGSTDGTHRLARKASKLLGLGIEILRFPKNQGKAAAFIEGLRYLRENYFKVRKFTTERMLLLDCDIGNVNKTNVTKLLSRLGKTGNPLQPYVNPRLVKDEKTGQWHKIIEPVRIAMVVGTIKGFVKPNSGQRAFLLSSLNGLINNPDRRREFFRSKKHRGGYALEYMLNRHFMGREMGIYFSDFQKPEPVESIPRVDFIPTTFTHGAATETGKRIGRSRADALKVDRDLSHTMQRMLYTRDTPLIRLEAMRNQRAVALDPNERILRRAWERYAPNSHLPQKERIAAANADYRRRAGIRTKHRNFKFPKARRVFGR